MRNGPRGDVWKVWLYAAAVVALGAWVTPLLYNAGKALAEVTLYKTTNGPLKSLGAMCRAADFPRFFQVGLSLAAVLLFFPWLKWLRAKRGASADLAKPAPPVPGGGWWRKTVRGLWLGCAGFLLVAGLWFMLALAARSTGVGVNFHPAGGWKALVWRTGAVSLALAVVMEVVFRGIAMGIFLRAMRPSAALAMNAVLFTLALGVIPPPGLTVTDPDAAGTGFEMLRLLIWRCGEWQGVCQTVVPLVTLGGVLAYARWRTGTLWLPIGLHTGWLFAQAIQPRLLVFADSPTAVLSGTPLRQAVIPVIVIIMAGVLAHFLTSHRDAEQPAQS